MMTFRRITYIVCILCSVFCTPAHAALSMQELSDSLMAYTGFSRVWAPPVKVKNMRINGNEVTLKTNGTLRDYRWTTDNIAELKRKVSLWTLENEKGRVTIYSNGTDIETLITACAKGKSQTSGKYRDLTERNIVVYPSHGLYFNRDRDEWIWQRATLWTTVEDLYSQEYVRLVKRMLENAGANVLMPRAGIEDQEPGMSGMPQWTEGARYWLMSHKADSALWNLYDGNEYKDDMKCRAMWVNAQPNIDLCLAFHTDGNDSGNDSTVIGTLVIYTAKDDDGNTVLRDGRDREKTNRNFADWIQTQVTEDLKHIAPEWTRRQLKEANYCETRVPIVPSIILELLSHKNMADMKYGLDPSFRFAASRAVYKGILRYLNGTSAVVQPLPVRQLGISMDGHLQWKAETDSLEPTAIPTYYMVYTQEDDGEWDVQQVEKTQLTVELKQGVRYNFYVIAGNDGGLSFPSPVISAYRSENEDAPKALIVDAFDDVYAPDWFADSTYAGIVPGSYACEDGFSCAYIGQQWNYTRASQWTDDDNCGWGSCYRDHAGQLTVGNTHDWCSKHGRVLRRMRISYVSCTAEMIEIEMERSEEAPEYNFQLMDIICGRQRQPISTTLASAIEIYTGQVGKVLLSTDHFSAINPTWAKQYLHAQYYAAQATRSGRIKGHKNRLYQLMLEPNAEQLFTCHPEGLKPADKDAVRMATYEDMRVPAAVGSTSSLVFGFPLEAAVDFERIYRHSIEWLLKE